MTDRRGRVILFAGTAMAKRRRRAGRKARHTRARAKAKTPATAQAPAKSAAQPPPATVQAPSAAQSPAGQAQPAATAWRPPQQKTGRKLKLTPELMEKIVQLVRVGTPQKYAAGACGVGEATFYDWCRRFQAFQAAIKKAESEAISRNVGIINIAAKSTWQAAAWWLERRFPDQFGRKMDFGVGEDGGKVIINFKPASQKAKPSGGEQRAVETDAEIKKAVDPESGPAGGGQP